MVQVNLFVKQKLRQSHREKNIWTSRGKVVGRDEFGDWDLHIYTAMYKLDN